MTNSFSAIHIAFNGEVCGYTKIRLNKCGNYEFENFIDSGESNLTLRGTFTKNEARELHNLLSIELNKECEA